MSDYQSPEFIVTGGDYPPDEAPENSLFLRASDNKYLRMTNGEWVELEGGN